MKTALSATLKRVQQARTSLLLDNPFFGVLALQLEQVEDATIQTACTNGQQIRWSPAFVATLSQDELCAVLAHEVMHCALGHPWRRDNRTPKRWNIACDYAINPLLSEARFKLPADALNDPQWKDRWAEYIYDRLPNDPNSDGDSNSGSSGTSSLGDVEDSPSAPEKDDGDSDSDGDGSSSGPSSGPSSSNPSPILSESDWKQLTQQSLQGAKMQGKLLGNLARLISDATQAREDWQSLLRRFVQDYATADYSWSNPSRRYLASGLYLPSLRSQELGRIVVAIDTSGSIDDVLLAQFASELNAIADECKPSAIDVVYCDARINHVDTFERNDPITLAPYGGGGTDFRPVFNRIDASDDPPVCVIYLTDLFGTFPSQAPEYPVIWAVCGSNAHPTNPPFGELVP